MSSSIGSFSPNDLANALLHEISVKAANGPTTTIKYGSSTSAKSSGGSQGGTATSPDSIVSFSPEANATLTKDQIALQVINRNPHQKPTHPQASAPSTFVKAARDQPPTDTPGDNGTALLDQYKQMSAPDRFYATMEASNMDFAMTPEDKAGFDAAFASRTLIIQDAADVPLLDYKQTVTLWAGGSSDTNSFSSAWQPQPGQQAFVLGTEYGGGMVVSWASPPTSTKTATMAEPNSTSHQ